ncbi:MAG TPA: HEAT repeat domain-containing protein [Candidatus Didemnitutus sp.]|jgi:HEAT repeat protein
MKKATLSVVAIIAFGLITLFWVRHSSRPPTGLGGPSKEEPAEGSVSGTTDAPQTKVSMQRAAIRRKLDWHDAATLRVVIAIALATKDVKKWAPALAELRNPKVKTQEALEILEDLLKSDDWQVRIRAAHILSERGSAAGVNTLQEAMRAAVGDTEIPTEAVLEAGETLNRRGTQIDPTALQSLYEKRNASEFLSIAAQQGDDWVSAYVQTERSNPTISVKTRELAAAEVGMSDPASIASFQNLTGSSDPDLKAIGNWALFQAAGDKSNLQAVEASAENFLHLNGPESATGSRIALGLLSLTDDPAAIAEMEKVADFTAKNVGGAYGFDSALLSLYSVGNDNQFIDDRIKQYLNGGYLAPGASSGLIWEIAASRNDPEIDQLAKAHNSESYELYFVRREGFAIPAVKLAGKAKRVQ